MEEVEWWSPTFNRLNRSLLVELPVPVDTCTLEVQVGHGCEFFPGVN